MGEDCSQSSVPVCGSGASAGTTSSYTASVYSAPSTTTCSAGQYLSGSSCTNCEAGKFKAGSNADTSCTACPSNANSLAASDAASDCTCNSGYTGTVTGTTTASGSCEKLDDDQNDKSVPDAARVGDRGSDVKEESSVMIIAIIVGSLVALTCVFFACKRWYDGHKPNDVLPNKPNMLPDVQFQDI